MIRKIIINIFALVFLITNTSFADIKFWTTEVQPARMAKQEEMAKAFEAKTGIKVEVIPIEERSWDKSNCSSGGGRSSRCDLSHSAICFTMG